MRLNIFFFQKASTPTLPRTTPINKIVTIINLSSAASFSLTISAFSSFRLFYGVYLYEAEPEVKIYTDYLSDGSSEKTITFPTGGG